MFPQDCDCGSIDVGTIFRAVAEDENARQFYSAAYGRIAVEKAEREAEEQRDRDQAERDSETPLQQLLRTVHEALAAGATVICPNCRSPTEKNDACMHMVRAYTLSCMCSRVSTFSLESCVANIMCGCGYVGSRPNHASFMCTCT
jgi:hypothetical protein